MAIIKTKITGVKFGPHLTNAMCSENAADANNWK